MIKKFLILVGIIAIAFVVYLAFSKGRGIEEAKRKVGETKSLVEDTAKDVVSGIKADTREIIDAISDKSREAIVEAKDLGIVVRKKGDNIIENTRSAAGDAAITARIKAQLARDKGLSLLDINVSTLNRKVTLSGKANSPQEVARAVDIALNTEGVKEVVSAIAVKKGG
ncbi:MAG: BON domain-containing protein [Nitrospirae bacterium]|nr:BON domain-containing protein [Nitrospirota bacterium]